MEEFLPGTGLSTGLIPGLSGWVGREWTALGIFLLLLGGLEMGLVSGLQGAVMSGPCPSCSLGIYIGFRKIHRKYLDNS